VDNTNPVRKIQHPKKKEKLTPGKENKRGQRGKIGKFFSFLRGSLRNEGKERKRDTARRGSHKRVGTWDNGEGPNGKPWDCGNEGEGEGRKGKGAIKKGVRGLCSCRNLFN